jgi:hypothetical protein
MLQGVKMSGLNVVNNILDKWGVTTPKKIKILGLPNDVFSSGFQNLDDFNLTQVQLERLSYVLNIHASLRTIFSNSNNVYGFMGMPNHNDFFNGRSPISIIEDGGIEELREVAKNIAFFKDY